LLEDGHKVVVACNDPMDLPAAEPLFAGWFPDAVICPDTPEKYFRLLAASRAVLSGRLHTAVVAFSLGIPFLLLDVDQRTHGFIKTYQLEDRSIIPSLSGLEARLSEHTDKMLSGESSQSWELFIEKRNNLYEQAMDLLKEALKL